MLKEEEDGETRGEGDFPSCFAFEKEQRRRRREMEKEVLRYNRRQMESRRKRENAAERRRWEIAKRRSTEKTKPSYKPHNFSPPACILMLPQKKRETRLKTP